MIAVKLLAASAALLAATFAAVETDAAFLACATAPATAGDRRTVKTQIKYTTYNAEFLFLQGLGTLKCPGADCKWETATAAQNHIVQVAKIIKSLDSDILQLTEVEDCTVLNAVITQLAQLGDSTYKPYLLRGTDTATGQNVGLLTRVDPSANLQRSTSAPSIPVSGSKCPSASGFSSTKSVSKHFYTTFNVPGFTKPLTVVGAHLLANPEDKVRCYEREAQATVLASLANAAILNGNHAIISGDLNDWSSSVPDRNNNAPISNVLGILTGSTMVQTAANATQATRYSQWFDKNKDCTFLTTEVSSLDHILVSKSLSSAVTSVKFHNDLYTASCTGLNSDHYPITVTINAA
ncbi:hypothetical protein PybrP1_008104 [[Pythium] brassicae (nom. inval.)]|nr:hypothetical protein PybrP1_008104 [[Pythium] brassicae (nom. inval.)]